MKITKRLISGLLAALMLICLLPVTAFADSNRNGNLPDAYTQLQYVESTGTQYIDTGFVPNQDTKIDITFSCGDVDNDRTYVFGAAGDNYTDNAFELYPWDNNGGQKWQVNWGNNLCSFPTEAHTNTKVRFVMDMGQYQFYEDETLIAEGVFPASTFTSPNTITLCALNRNAETFCSFDTDLKIYECSIWDDETLVRQYIPAVRNCDKTVGVYDFVCNTFVESNSEYPFIADGVYERYDKSAAEIIPKIDSSKYTIVDYIESNGMQAIDIGLTVNACDRAYLSVDVQAVDLATKNYPNYAGSDWYLAYTLNDLPDTDRHRMEVEYNCNGNYTSYCFLDNDFVKALNRSRIVTRSAGIGLFSMGAQNGEWYNLEYNQIARVYGAKIIINDKLERFFIPVHNNKTHQNGLYDLVNDRFYGNSLDNSNFSVPHDNLREHTLVEGRITRMPTNTESGCRMYYCTECSCDVSGEIEIPAIDSEKYQVVEYIESNGKQAIDTGLHINRDDSACINMDYQFLASGPCNWSGTNYYLQFPADTLQHYDRTEIRDVYIGGIGGEFGRHFTYEGERKLHSNDWHSIPNLKGNAKIALFTLGDIDDQWWMDGYSQIARLYGCEISINSRQERFFIPVIEAASGKTGLLDLCENKFYSNVWTNSGDFDVPHDESEYTAIDSITFDGTKYVLLSGLRYNSLLVNGESLDGKTIEPSSINGVTLGYNPEKSTIFTVKEINCRLNGKETAHLIPKVCTVDNRIGLYDTTSHRFYSLQSIDPIGINACFEDSEKYNPDIAQIALDSVSGIDLFNSWNLLAYWQIPEDDSELPMHTTEFYLRERSILKDGEIYNLYLLNFPGTETDNEWASNVTMGGNDRDFHEGFENAADSALSMIREHLSNDKEHDKIIISGYSRGAAIAGIAAAKLMEEERFTKDNTFVYTFACPNYSRRQVNYNNIFHIDNRSDVITKMPSQEWGFQKEGVEILLPDTKEVRDKLNELLLAYQSSKLLPEKGFYGFDHSIDCKMKKLGTMITDASSLNDPKVINLITNVILTLGGTRKSPLNSEDIHVAINLILSNGNYSDMIDIALFFVVENEKITGSHEWPTYFYWTQIMNELGLYPNSQEGGVNNYTHTESQRCAATTVEKVVEIERKVLRGVATVAVVGGATYLGVSAVRHMVDKYQAANSQSEIAVSINTVSDAQQWLNDNYDAGLTVDGGYGNMTKQAIVKALQKELGFAETDVDGVAGQKTLSALPELNSDSQGNTVVLLQCLLMGNGYGNDVEQAILALQKAQGMPQTGVCDSQVWMALLG